MLFCHAVVVNLLTLHKFFITMKLILAILMTFLPIAAFAQSEWEKPNASAVNVGDEAKQETTRTDPDAKYLEGAVPEVDGKVEWTLDVNVPGKDAEQIYDIMLQYLTNLTKSENQLEGSCVALVNKAEHIVVANVREWLVFTDKFFALDRTKFNYTLIAYCKDGGLTVKMNRIYYIYDDNGSEKGGTAYKAEEWINDENAMNRKKTKLYRGPGKFRRKTIDRKDSLFKSVKAAVLSSK